MLHDLVVPEVGESIREVQILRWNKRPGDQVRKNEELVEIETEKATVAIPSPASGRLEEVLKADSDFAEVGDVIARIADSADAPSHAESAKPAAVAEEKKPAEKKTAPQKPVEKRPEAKPPEPPAKAPLAPLVPRRTKPTVAESKPTVAGGKPASGNASPQSTQASERREEIVPMSGLRRTIARKLVEAQRNAALLTTFNEVDMQAVMELRKEFGEPFRREYDVKLGFMSFFVKAVVDALTHNPELNAEVRDEQIVFRNYFDIGVAIGSERGLVVPILRDCQSLSFAEIEKQILDFASRASAGKISPADLTGGTFTISNGGVYGSLLSTPIVNPPQSGVLGMHTIQERPVAINGQVVIRPMMYLALTYDHRLVDGRQAVGFLRRIKDVLETPSRLLLGI